MSPRAGHGDGPVSEPDGLTVTRVLAVAAASLALGGLTVLAQGALPEQLVSFANSASGWTLLTALLVVAARAPGRRAAVLGAASFILLVLGYSLVAGWIDLFYDPRLFSAIGLVAGPVVGLAASWLRADGWRAAAGAAVLGGIGIGEGVYGLASLAETTSPVYWWVVIVLGIALLAGMLARRVRGTRPVVIALAGAVLVAGLFLLAYPLVGSVGLL